MTYRQYLDISPGPGPLAPFASRLESAMRDVVGDETTGHEPSKMTPAETRAFEQLLATKTLAVKDAPAASGKFPVILYHPGTGGTYEDNSALFEYLASRGYIVVSSAYPAPDAHSVFIEGDIAGSFADLDFLVNFARTLPNTDADRLGVMGHSYGAWVSFAWTAKEGSPVRALITLDSGFEYDSLSGGPELLQLHMKRNRNNIRAATLRVASTERHPHFEYLDPYLKFVPRYEASITSLKHNDYLTHGAIGPDLLPEKWPDARKDRRASYDRLSEVICQFPGCQPEAKDRGQSVPVAECRPQRRGQSIAFAIQSRRTGPTDATADGAVPSATWGGKSHRHATRLPGCGRIENGWWYHRVVGLTTISRRRSPRRCWPKRRIRKTRALRQCLVKYWLARVTKPAQKRRIGKRLCYCQMMTPDLGARIGSLRLNAG